MGVTHLKTSPFPNNAARPNQIGGDDWDANHVMANGTSRILGRVTAGAGAVEELTAAQVAALVGATGQIPFPVTQNASANANTFDDYEEGTFTPGINFGGGAAGITLSTQSGHYLKWGKWVAVRGYVALSNKGSSTGSIAWGNLPFALQNVAGSFTCFSSYANSLTGISGGILAHVGAAGVTVSFGYSATGTRVSIADTHCTNTSDFMIAGVYPTDN